MSGSAQCSLKQLSASVCASFAPKASIAKWLARCCRRLSVSDYSARSGVSVVGAFFCCFSSCLSVCTFSTITLTWSKCLVVLHYAFLFFTRPLTHTLTFTATIYNCLPRTTQFYVAIDSCPFNPSGKRLDIGKMCASKRPYSLSILESDDVH